ncbi:uncharacterized protein hemgn isoform 1-T1 [Menidia menidia]
MEETSQPEKNQELELKNQIEEEGGIRRRLRDRDLLRKRKAEAEEKETNQWVWGVESQRKRSRTGDKSGSKKRGRPRKSEPVLSVIQEEPVVTREAPAVVVAPGPAALISDQISGPLTPVLAVESQPASFLVAPAPAPVLQSVQNTVFGPFLTSPPPLGSALGTSSVLIQSSAPVQVPNPAPVQAPDAAPALPLDIFSAPALSQDSAPAASVAPPPAPPQVETLYTESQARDDQVLIEDLGPDEEEDVSPSQERRVNEGLNEALSVNVPEQTKMYSVPTLSSSTLPQEYLPGN